MRYRSWHLYRIYVYLLYHSITRKWVKSKIYKKFQRVLILSEYFANIFNVDFCLIIAAVFSDGVMSIEDAVGSGLVGKLQRQGWFDAVVRLCYDWRDGCHVTAMRWHAALRPCNTRHHGLCRLDGTSSGPEFRWVCSGDVKVSRPAWSRDANFGLGLGLTVIGLGLGLVKLLVWVLCTSDSWSPIDHRLSINYVELQFLWQ